MYWLQILSCCKLWYWHVESSDFGPDSYLNNTFTFQAVATWKLLYLGHTGLFWSKWRAESIAGKIQYLKTC